MRPLMIALIMVLCASTVHAASLRGVNGKLVSAYRFVKSRCAGVYPMRGVSPGRIPSGRRSLHNTGNALDFHANSYRCAYRALRAYGWKGGMSNDGARCNHIHISVAGSHREKNGFRHRRC